MIPLTATAIGFATAPMRSVVAMAAVGIMICLAYLAAAFVSPGPTSLIELVVAIISYDGGLLACLLGLHAIHRIRARAQTA